MPVVGVDLSGIVGVDPSVYAVGVKLLSKEQKHRIICLGPDRHNEYKECTRNWREKLTAILIYLASVDLYTSLDVITIDVDFEGKRRDYVTRCLKRLFGVHFSGQHPLNNPNIVFTPARHNETVKKADKKSKLARHKEMLPSVRDPDLAKQLRWLDSL